MIENFWKSYYKLPWNDLFLVRQVEIQRIKVCAHDLQSLPWAYQKIKEDRVNVSQWDEYKREFDQIFFFLLFSIQDKINFFSFILLANYSISVKMLWTVSFYLKDALQGLCMHDYLSNAKLFIVSIYDVIMANQWSIKIHAGLPLVK